MQPHKITAVRASQPPTDHRKKLTDAEVIEIRRRYSIDHVRQQTLAAEFGVSQTQISQIVRYKSRWSGPGVSSRASFGTPPTSGHRRGSTKSAAGRP